MSLYKGNQLISGGLPNQGGKAGKYLKTDGTQASWAPIVVPTKISDLTDDTSTHPIDKADTLTGLTASITELNYTSGLTSSIQGQINSKVTANNAITGSTKCKITYDSKGLVTGGSNLVASDIPSLNLSKISDVSVTANEVNYLASATGNIQTQLNNKVEKNNAITGSTKCKITYDSKGLVTAGANLTESDIPSLHLNKITDVTATASEVNYLSGVTSNIQGQINTKLNITDVINNITTTTTNQALSANMGKELQDQINNLKQRGRYLSIWNASTGLAETEPTVAVYNYKAGDYFLVGVVASQGGTNYMPNGSTYSKDVPSTTVETGTVIVNDAYYYDGTSWTLLHTEQPTVAFSTLAGSPYDNSNLTSALNAKVTANNAITGATKTKITYDSKGLVTSGTDLTASDIPDLSSIYQSKLYAGQNISITTGEIVVPSDYEQLEYIIVNSGSSIDTGITPYNHTATMKVNDIEYVNDKHYFGTSSGPSYYHFTTYSNSYYWGYSGSEGSGGVWSSGIHTISYNSGVSNEVVIDNQTMSQDHSITSYTNLEIGRRDGTSNFMGWIFYFKLTDKDTNNLVFNGIPAKRKSDDVVGLYDTITGAFFTDNTGNGFEAGTPIADGATINSQAVNDNSTTSTTLGWSASKINSSLSTKYDASNPNGYTSNTGTITGITMNGASKGTSGVVDLGTVITSHQDISGKENTSNKVASISSSSTDIQYPSAKCVYDIVGNIEATLQAIRGV